MVEVLIHTVETTVLTLSSSRRHHSGRRASRHRTPVGTAAGRWSFDPADPQSWQQHREIVDATHDKQSTPFTKSSATLALVEETTAQFVYSNNLLPQYIENLATWVLGVVDLFAVLLHLVVDTWHDGLRFDSIGRDEGHAIALLPEECHQSFRHTQQVVRLQNTSTSSHNTMLLIL